MLAKKTAEVVSYPKGLEKHVYILCKQPKAQADKESLHHAHRDIYANHRI